ncbi:hypothetical protein GGI08_004665 [Coemansia sp. S2]|nr:hypothetical protein GGI08_004665 [Coemansia sp. S2]
MRQTAGQLLRPLLLVELVRLVWNRVERLRIDMRDSTRTTQTDTVVDIMDPTKTIYSCVLIEQLIKERLYRLELHLQFSPPPFADSEPIFSTPELVNEHC